MSKARFEGRVALVTGAASGIGRATALRLAGEGARVVLTDLQDAEAVARDIEEAGGEALFIHHDVSDPVGWERALEGTRERFGRLDVLVNNAGIGDTATIEETDLDEYAKTIAVDQTGVFLGMKLAAPLLIESRHGSIVNVSSIFGTTGGFGAFPAYHAAKGAITTLTKNAALHWATEGIRVNSIHPGFIDTPLLEYAKGTPFEDLMVQTTPMARLGLPEEVAAGIAYLASDDASFVTGSELYVDGGYTAR